MFGPPSKARFERLAAIRLGASIFLDEMTKAARSDARDAEEIVFALHETNGESMHREYVLTLQGVRVIST
jgi:hypothetical protein